MYPSSPLYTTGIVLGLFFYLALLVGIQVLYAFGPYRMAKHAGIPHAWLGLLPIGSGWLLGLLAERSLYTRTGKQRRLALWLPALQGFNLCAAALVLGLAILDMDFGKTVTFALLFFLATFLAAMIFFYYVLYYVFLDYAPESAVLFTVLSVIFRWLHFIFLLIEMNVVPVSVAGPGPFPYGRPKYDRNHQWFLQPQEYGPPQGYTPPQGYAPYPPSQSYPGATQPPYPPGPAQQPPYSGQSTGFYQGNGYYQPPAQPFDPSRSFPSGGYDPKHPEDFRPPENGPEL